MDPSEVSTLSELLETVYMCGSVGVVSVLRKLRSHWGDCELQFFKEDWVAGYRQLVLHPSHRRFFVAAAENEAGEVVCFLPRRLLFGPSRCPAQFSRMAECFERILASLLWVVSTHHVDDHIGFEKIQHMHSARRAVRRLAQILQIPL